MLISWARHPVVPEVKRCAVVTETQPVALMHASNAMSFFILVSPEPAREHQAWRLLGIAELGIHPITRARLRQSPQG
jgi:hypothetical protein